MDPEPRLKIRLIRGWISLENPEGPVTYFREASPVSGALQFSFARYKSGSLPNTTDEQLIGICRNLTAKVEGGRVTLSQSGNCDFGIFGTVAVRGDDPVHLQAWVLSNHRDFILVTHTCMTEPGIAEMSEATQIALMTRIQ